MEQFWASLVISVCAVGVTSLQTFFTFRQYQIMKQAQPPGRSKRKPQEDLFPTRRLMTLYGAMLALLILAWVPYMIHPDDLQEWPHSEGYIITYGENGDPGVCNMSVHSRLFMQYRNGYKLAVVCFFYDGIGDVLDAPQIQVSKLYDISGADLEMKALWSSSFKELLFKKHASGLENLVLLIPSGIDPGQFDTLRQAKGLGVKIFDGGVASGGTLLVSHL
jgi:hypothetical protein